MFNSYSSEVTHAYVKYTLDNVKEIVPITYIKDFEPKSSDDFSKTKIYKCFWRHAKYPKGGKYYDANILKLGESANELDEAIKFKRVAVTTQKDNSEEETGKKEKSPCSGVQKGAGILGNQHLLKEILAEKVKQRKCTPLVDTSATSETAVDDNFCAANKIRNDYKQKYKNKKLECKALKQKLEEMEQSSPNIRKKEVEKLRKINAELQEQLLALIGNASDKNQDTALEKHPNLFKKSEGKVSQNNFLIFKQFLHN